MPDTRAVPADYPFLKGHGTHNDFVVLPDPDGSVHGDLAAERVRALCDRRGGIGGDGVLRVVRAEPGAGAEWFMDYRNADGSVSEMCGNGIRVFGRYLVEAGLADASQPLPVATRDGVKTLTFATATAATAATATATAATAATATTATDPDGSGLITVDMGTPRLLGESKVSVDGHTWAATHVDMGNPHAVAFVDDLADAGALTTPPEHDERVYPAGVNVEFVVRRGAHHVAMRVHERGSGETQSCGTGACAVAVAAALVDDAPRGTSYRVDLPGGTLTVVWTAEDRVLMTGPALIVAQGTTSL